MSPQENPRRLDKDGDTQHPITVGVVAPPGAVAGHAEMIAAELPDLLTERVDSRVPWQAETIIDPLTGAGNALEILDQTERARQHEDWDLAICLTDLPIYRRAGTPGRSGRLVVADLSNQRGIAVLSLPLLGVWGLRRRLRQAIVRLTGELRTGAAPSRTTGSDQAEQEETAEQRESATAGQLMTGRVTTLAIPTQRRGPDETETGIDSRFYSPLGRGHLRLCASMVAANRPWAMFHNFTAVIALAFATGAYGLIFQSMYYLTDYFGPARFVMMMLLSMVAMVVWIIVSHHLWEPTPGERDSLPLTALYNWITILTLVIAVLIAYTALYTLLLVAAVVFVPSDYLQSTLGHPITAGTYGLLAWIAASIATVAGALGAGLESDDEVRQVTFGARQQRRLTQAQSASDADPS